MCPNCNAHMKVDPSCMLARCDACGTECLVQDALKALSSVTVKQDIQVGNATFNVSSTNTDALLKRVEIMLADGDFYGAMSKCDTILDSDPTNGKVYFYMLLSSLKCRNKNELANQSIPFDGNQYYINVIRYGDNSLKSELEGYINVIKARNEAERKREEEENEAKRKREEEENEAKLKDLKVGVVFFFGSYKEEHIYWKVHKIQDRMALVISTDNICTMPYHETYTNTTWSDCTLRKWLNSEFINESFTQAEQARILPCKINNDKNPEAWIPNGAPTIDKVFLLSRNEADTLFDNDYDRVLRSNGWWLRTSGRCLNQASVVLGSGRIYYEGTRVNAQWGIRPAMWIKLDA